MNASDAVLNPIRDEDSLSLQLVEARLGHPLHRLGPLDREILKQVAGSLAPEDADQIQATIRQACEVVHD